MNQPRLLNDARAAIALVVVACGIGRPAEVTAAAVSWQQTINLNEFQGLAGGFETNGTVLQDRSGVGASSRKYDVLKPAPTGAATKAQDGQTDFSIRSVVQDGSGGSWKTEQLEHEGNQLQSHITTSTNSSHSGDSALMAFEITFSQGLGLTADRLAVNLAGINGKGDLYEWAFVTVGGVADAPFDPSLAAVYSARDYNVVPPGVTPGSGPAIAFANGRPISSFLTGDTRTTPANGLVQAGWWAAEGFNVSVTSGNESGNNPGPATGVVDKNYTVTGASLGLAPLTLIQKITIWFGYNDVGFDTNGNGTTHTNGDQTQGISSITIGSTAATAVPEPEAPALAALGLACLLIRIRRL